MSFKPNTIAATKAYESWLAAQVPLNKADILAKHKAMNRDAFSFFRATYYRWAEVWPVVGREWAVAPKVLSVGDVHVENFGTWRDAEARLVWGINDFDECGALPFTHDLVRLATSAHFAFRVEALHVLPRLACAALLEGYTACMKAGGRPFVLEEENGWLRTLAMGKQRHPTKYWSKLNDWPVAGVKPPSEVLTLLRGALPDPKMTTRIIHRRSGLGSLGRPRYALVGKWKGAAVAREAKAIVPNAFSLKKGTVARQAADMHRMINNTLRCTDPMNEVIGGWVFRRLSPQCSRISLADLPKARDEEQLLHAMGWELANTHLASPKAQAGIKANLAKRPHKWLLKAADVMAEAMLAEWKAWRKRKC